MNEIQTDQQFFTTAEVAEKMGMTAGAIRALASKNSDQLIKDVDFTSRTNSAGGDSQTFWTKQGVQKLLLLKGRQEITIDSLDPATPQFWIFQKDLEQKARQYLQSQIASQKALIEELTPKANWADQCNPNGLTETRHFAKSIGISAVAFNKWAREQGLFYQSWNGGKKINVVKQEFIDRGWFEQKEIHYQNKNLEPYTQIFITEKGKPKVFELWKQTQKVTSEVQVFA